MKTRLLLIALAIFSIHGCKKMPAPNPIPGSSDEPEAVVIVPAVQIAGLQETYAIEGVTGGLHLNFEMSGINYLELESVDGYAIAGTATEGQSIITFTAASGGTLTPGEDYYITSFPCDVYGGYRLSIYKDGLVAHYFGVHQVIEADEFISPLDLDESTLEFADPDAPLFE